VHEVCEELFKHRQLYIEWPESANTLAQKFYDIAGMPSVCACMDGSHVLINPPRDTDAAFISRHQTHTINVLAVCSASLEVG
jgi:hypothetical protein